MFKCNFNLVVFKNIHENWYFIWIWYLQEFESMISIQIQTGGNSFLLICVIPIESPSIGTQQRQYNMCSKNNNNKISTTRTHNQQKCFSWNSVVMLFFFVIFFWHVNSEQQSSERIYFQFVGVKQEVKIFRRKENATGVDKKNCN